MPKCRRCRETGDVEGWGRRRNGWLKQLCPACDSARLAKQERRRLEVAAWRANRGVLKCGRCGVAVTGRPDWGRYENGGRFKALCPACDAERTKRREAARKRDAAAIANGYPRGWSSTPEARRLQRERDAAKQDRTLCNYVTRDEREHHARMVEADRFASSIRSRWAAEWLCPFRKSDAELYWDDPAYREQQKAKYRSSYARRIEFERARARAWNVAHPEERDAQRMRREERMLCGSDGTATAQAISRLKRAATHCAYCACVLGEKQTDHMFPLVLGGEHSLRNVVIVCPECNGKKSTLSYAEWLERVAPEHRARVLALYQERYAEAAA